MYFILTLCLSGLMALCLRSTYGVNPQSVPAQSKRSLELREMDPRAQKPDTQELWQSKKTRTVSLEDIV